VIERLRAAIARARTGNRIVVIVVGAVAVITIVAVGLLIAVRGGGTAQASPTPSAVVSPSASPSPSPSDSPSPEPTPSPTIDLSPTTLPQGWAYSDLDGVGAPADLAHRLPLGVSIGDNIAARPQSGFSSASIVYQSYEEYGQDRYMMIFQEGTATDIGGVRSGRNYFVRWAAEYKALYAHDGGDTKTLGVSIPAMRSYFYDENASNGGSCPYHRITTRVAPHNEYTSSAALIGCLAQRSYPATYQGGPGRVFVDDTPLAARPASQSITIAYHTVTVGYQYDPATDSYRRLLDSKLQIDPANNQQVYARNIIVMFQPVTNDYMDFGIQRINIGNVGSGSAIVFQEGKAINATWKKASDSALTRYYDASGVEIPLVRGEIFIQSVPPGTPVTNTK
jgi:hypothetical protein